VSSTTSQSAEPVVKIDQEKISGGILALQRKCGFRYGSGANTNLRTPSVWR
jgi:hypothetical protein